MVPAPRNPGFAWAPVLGILPNPFTASQLTLHNPVTFFQPIALAPDNALFEDLRGNENQQLVIIVSPAGSFEQIAEQG